MCSALNPAKPTCPTGTTFDSATGHCSDGVNALGPFSQRLIAACAAHGGTGCTSPTWRRDFLLELQDTTDLTSTPIAEVFDEVKARPWVYCQPTAQDGTGNGMRQVGSTPVPGSARSEDVYLPSVLGPRRQVDSLVRQLYLLLPLSVRRTYAFVVADRLLQNPEAYIRYLRSRPQTVIVGSFVGIGQNTSYTNAARDRHADEMWKLRTALKLVRSAGRSVADLVYAMGDSSSPLGLTVRGDLQTRMTRIVNAASLQAASNPIGWGADETLAVALSRRLPDYHVKVAIENPNALQHYDGERPAGAILAEKLSLLKLLDVTGTSQTPDFEIAVLTRRPGGYNADYQTADAQQAKLDDAFLKPYLRYKPFERQKLVLIDARLFNGAWDAKSALKNCDFLGYGSWGTFGNVVGSTLAVARIQKAYGTADTRARLYLEAVAHDAFANGYAEAQRGALRDQVNAQLGANTFSQYSGYTTPATTAAVFGILNNLVAARMPQHFAGTSCVTGRTYRFTPQLWRTFESEVHQFPVAKGDLFVPGVYRTDLGAAFDPTQGRPEHLRLDDLLAE